MAGRTERKEVKHARKSQSPAAGAASSSSTQSSHAPSKRMTADREMIAIYLEHCEENPEVLPAPGFLLPALNVRATTTPSAARAKLLRDVWPSKNKYVITMIREMWFRDRPLFVKVFARACKMQHQTDKMVAEVNRKPHREQSTSSSTTSAAHQVVQRLNAAIKQKERLEPLIHAMALLVAIECRGQSQEQLLASVR
jgi:hypothetical protein